MKECNFPQLKEDLQKLAQRRAQKEGVYCANVSRACVNGVHFSMGVSPEGVVINLINYASFADQRKCLDCNSKPPEE